MIIKQEQTQNQSSPSSWKSTYFRWMEKKGKESHLKLMVWFLQSRTWSSKQNQTTYKFIFWLLFKRLMIPKILFKLYLKLGIKIPCQFTNLKNQTFQLLIIPTNQCSRNHNWLKIWLIFIVVEDLELIEMSLNVLSINLYLPHMGEEQWFADCWFSGWRERHEKECKGFG